MQTGKPSQKNKLSCCVKKFIVYANFFIFIKPIISFSVRFCKKSKYKKTITKYVIFFCLDCYSLYFLRRMSLIDIMSLSSLFSIATHNISRVINFIIFFILRIFFTPLSIKKFPQGIFPLH